MRALPIIAGFLISFSSQAQIQLRYQTCTNCSTQEGGDNPSESYSYGDFEVYESLDVTSDFGARFYPGYDWHKGVDYRPFPFAGANDLGRGTAIIAAETGTVHLIRANQGFKYIVMDSDPPVPFIGQDFGYAHIFNSRNPSGAGIQSGAFVLKPIDDTNPAI